ncbi:MAG TPA: AMIN domain-containing protein [Anaeromyxobacteraceae bacterium]|nr:AMIN domain-containing protein [Anaeromyxobacteraceae bacterium]
MTSLLALLLAANASGSTNVISRVGVTDVGAAIEVTISGSRVPSFTTFATNDPARFVIDLPDAVLATHGPAATPDGAAVREVVAEQRVAEGMQQARVTLALSGAVEPVRVRTRGNDLIIRVARLPDAPAPRAAEMTAVAPPPAAKPVEIAAVAPPVQAAPEPTADSKAESNAVATVEPAPVVERAPATSRVETAAGAPPPSVARPPMQPTPEPKVDSKAAVAVVEPAPVVERAPVVEPAPVARPEPVVDPAPVVERSPAAKPVAVVAVSEPRPAAAAPERAAAPVPAPAAPAVAVAAPSATSDDAAQQSRARGQRRADERVTPRAVYAGIGFNHSAGVSRVLVRTIGAPQFTIREAGSSLVIVIQHARAARANDLLPLDTSFFPSVVRAVVPHRDAAGTRIEIQLRRMVAFRQEVEGDVLAIVFEAPEVAPGARR